MKEIWGYAFKFFKTIHGLSGKPMYKSYSPPPTTTTTTTEVTSRPAGLRPQVKIFNNSDSIITLWVQWGKTLYLKVAKNNV